jgi:outer membrane protein W
MKSAAIVAALLLFAGAPLMAQDRNVNFTVWYSQGDIEGENDFGGNGFETDFEDASGYGLSANWHFNPYVSLQGSAFALRSDATLLFDGGAPIADLGKLNLTAFMAGAQFHVLGKRRIDPYIGAGGAYMLSDDFHTADLDAAGVGRIELENTFAYYVNAGIGLQITEGLGIVLDARYIPYETNSRSAVTGVEQELDISPRIYSAGLRLRF